MGTVTVDGNKFEIGGTKPTDGEWQMIEAALQAKKSTPSAQPQQQQPDPENMGAAIAAAGSPTRPIEPGPGLGQLNAAATAAQKFEATTPIEAAKDLARSVYDPKTGKWFTSTPGSRDLGKVASNTVATVAPLSTDSPKRRQEIYVKQIPGAKAVEDRFGNPMVELDGKRYAMSGPDFDFARTALATAGGALIGTVAAPAGLLAGTLTAAGTMAGQSAAEDVVTRAAGSESGRWIDPGKAAVAGTVGALFRGGLQVAPAVAGRINELVLSGVPLTDDVLLKAGLTPSQISNMTPEIRDQVTTIARRTFGDKAAVGSTYRQELGRKFGLEPGSPTSLTMGEISQDPAQLIRERMLAKPASEATAMAPQIMAEKRAAQDAALTQAQNVLRIKAGGQVRSPVEASTDLQGIKDAQLTLVGKNVDKLYGFARDPLAVEAAGGQAVVPTPHATKLSDVVINNLAKDEVGRIALGDQAGNLTPNAKAALAAVDKWSTKAAGDTVPLYSPQGLLSKDLPPGATTSRFAMDQPGTVAQIPASEWNKIEDLRQVLVGYQSNAQSAVTAADKGTYSGTGNPKQDLAAINQIVKSFDDHFGKLNPLFKEARAAHSEMKSTFFPGGDVTQDKATKAVLTALNSPEGGTAVTDAIMAAKPGTAVQMLEHLNTKVFKDHPEAQGILKEQFLRRLQVDKDGVELSPLLKAKAIKQAFGDREGGIYTTLFSKEEQQILRQQQEVFEMLAKSRTDINPPGSGIITLAGLKNLKAEAMGAAAGTAIGSAIPIPGAAVPFMYAGQRIGGAIDRAVPPRLAKSAVSPVSNYYQGGAPSAVPGMLSAAATQPVAGPADKIINGLLMDLR